MNEPRYVFFDVDDTLIEWTVSWPDVFAQAAAEAGASVTAEQAVRALTESLETIYDGVVRMHAERADERAFWLDYEWMGAQRQLKVLGIFARLAHRDGKTTYLGDMPRVMAYLRRAATRYRALGNLARLLDELEERKPVIGYTF